MIKEAELKAKEHLVLLEANKKADEKKYNDQLKLEQEAFQKSSLAQKEVYEAAELARKELAKKQINQHSLDLAQR